MENDSMSNDPHVQGPFSAVGVPVAEAWQRHQNAPPHIKKDNTAYVGGLIVGAAGYIAVTLGLQARSFPREYVIGYAAITCIGLVMVASGSRESRGMPRDLFLAFRAIAIPVAGYIAMINIVPELWDLYLVRLFTVAVATGNAVRFWLAIRGTGGDARKLVKQDIADNELNWENE
jgi:hypothetical protein